MNDRLALKIKCPFYQGMVLTKRMACIVCEPLDKNLGFDTSRLVRLPDYAELKDFAELFCCDVWEQCPYAQAMRIIKYPDQ